MAGALWFRDAKKQGYEDGIRTGIEQGVAQQKAKDEKIIFAERERVAQKDAEVARQATEIMNQAKRIAELETLLKNKRS